MITLGEGTILRTGRVGNMLHCTGCDKELREGDALGLVRLQVWKTRAGSKECKGPDIDDTRTYCLTCVDEGRVHLPKR